MLSSVDHLHSLLITRLLTCFCLPSCLCTLVHLAQNRQPAMSAVIALRDCGIPCSTPRRRMLTRFLGLAVLETTPSTAPLPRPQWAGNEDVEIIAAALQDLLARDNSPPIRDYVLHVILAFPSSSIWENTALEWVHDTSTPADSEHEIHNYIVQALTENDFAPNKWIEASVKDANDSLRLRDVVVGWAGMHVNVSDRSPNLVDSSSFCHTARYNLTAPRIGCPF